MRRLAACLFVVASLTALTGSVTAQEAQEPVDAPAPEHHGKVLFERDTENSPVPTEALQTALPEPVATLTDAERNAPVFSAYDLDVHLTPATAAIAVHARIRVRNASSTPLDQLAMQLSSTLHWDSISLGTNGAVTPAKFVRQTIDSDVDHTGRVSEAVVTLPAPLAPGQEIALNVFYSGNIPASAERLERIGAPHDEALVADWDGIGTSKTGLRGFGDVLWYPAAAAPVLLGDGAKLFQAVGHAKQRQATASTRLRLTVEYVGEPPNAAYFCGRRAPLKTISENTDIPVVQAPGVATAEWPAQPLGFHAMSLFLTDQPSKPVIEDLLSSVTEHDDTIPSYTAGAKLVQPMLNEWFGAALDTATLIDQSGQPFADGTLLVGPMKIATPSVLAPTMVHVLTHAWFHSSHPWLDEGMPEFANLLWLERSQGREVALRVLADSEQPMALAEPVDLADDPVKTASQSLLVASNDVFFRAKAVAVFWMLRLMIGDDAMKQAIHAYRESTSLDADAQGFEKAIETASGKDLRWFFDDWVYNDRGLPDLSISNVTPNQMAPKPGGTPSWLVSVDVKNAGGAGALVPVTIRSGKNTFTQNLQIAAHAGATVRILCPAPPQEVIVNDGSVPEMAISGHRQDIVVH